MTDSYIEHNNQYILNTALNIERNTHKQKTIGALEKNGGKWDNLYKPGHLHGEWLDSQTEIINAVDIGCGTGWFVNYIMDYKEFENVIGIEPSNAAIEIAKNIYNNKINYLCGFAENELKKIKLEKPTLFTTFIVLSHINDSNVQKILKEMDNIAPKGSVFIFNENYGKEFHMNLWHCRTKKWWEENLPNWTITYDERERADLRYYKQGLMGFKDKTG
jgi:SAM-dependent methyltransferase